MASKITARPRTKLKALKRFPTQSESQNRFIVERIRRKSRLLAAQLNEAKTENIQFNKGLRNVFAVLFGALACTIFTLVNYYNYAKKLESVSHEMILAENKKLESLVDKTAIYVSETFIEDPSRTKDTTSGDQE